MYKPKLKYIFCLMRKRSLMPALSVMRYMNSVGIVPQLLINNIQNFGGDQHSLIVNKLNRWGVKYNEIRSLPTYDVMFSESGGHCSFEMNWLKESKKRGKSNIILLSDVSAFQQLVPSSFHKKFVEDKVIDGICAKIEKTVAFYKEFLGDIFLINIGDPEWDWWQTDEYKEKVEKARSELGHKVLVICEDYAFEECIPYTELCIERAESLNFKVVINIHPDRWYAAPKQFSKYFNTSRHHHVLFTVASHAISSIVSSVVAENLFLGTKVGCSPVVFHCKREGNHKWLNKHTWLKQVPKHVSREILNLISPIFDENDLNNFLSSESTVTVKSAEKAFGKINVPCYTEHLFETLDRKLGKESA